MGHINILVEGQTEEKFVNTHLLKYLLEKGITISPSIISTKKLKNGTKFKGGLLENNFSNFIADLNRLIRSTPHGLVTTLIDYYGLPNNFPNYDGRLIHPDALRRVKFLEGSLFEELGSPINFKPYVQLHEFEAMLFSSKTGFENVFEADGSLKGLLDIIDSGINPEEINDGSETAPSKRIIKCIPNYSKIIDGNAIIKEIGFEEIIRACPHLNEWINGLIDYFKEDS